jgi:hypothetical protein
MIGVVLVVRIESDAHRAAADLHVGDLEAVAFFRMWMRPDITLMTMFLLTLWPSIFPSRTRVRTTLIEPPLRHGYPSTCRTKIPWLGSGKWPPASARGSSSRRCHLRKAHSCSIERKVRTRNLTGHGDLKFVGEGRVAGVSGEDDHMLALALMSSRTKDWIKALSIAV